MRPLQMIPDLNLCEPVIATPAPQLAYDHKL